MSPKRTVLTLGALVPASAALVLTGVVLALVGGCSGKALAPSLGDAYRREIAELSQRLESASRENEELKTKLAAVDRPQSQLNAEEQAALPLLAGISVGGTTGLWPADSGTNACELRIYMSSHDGLGRFLQVTGSFEVSFVTLLEGCAPETVVCRKWTAAEVRDAWRSGFMGTHYTFMVPIDAAVACASGGVLRAVFRDALSGREFGADLAIGPTIAP